MIDELCQELRNYFDKGQPKFYGDIHIANGVITNLDFANEIKLGQYFRIIGSVLNDGVYCFNSDLVLLDEDFRGTIWLMVVPRAVIALDEEIDKWKEDNAAALASPYTSESFGGYSYSKATGKNGGGYTWQDAFASRLNMYRRIRV